MGNQLTCCSSTAVILTAIFSSVCADESSELLFCLDDQEYSLSLSDLTDQSDQTDEPESDEYDSISEAWSGKWEDDELTDKGCKLSLFVVRRDLGKTVYSYQQGHKGIFSVPAPEAQSHKIPEGYVENSTSYEVKEDKLEAIPSPSSLLDWKVSGYAFGRKMLTDPFEDDRQEILETVWKFQTRRIYNGTEHQEDEKSKFFWAHHKSFEGFMRYLGVEEHWYVFVKLTDPLNGSQAPRYAKLHLTQGQEENKLGEEAKRLVKEANIELKNYGSTEIRVDVLSEDIFNKRETNCEGGLRITDFHGSLTLRDMFPKNPHNSQVVYHITPEQPGTTELGLVMNCKTFAMRVLNELGVDKNPMGWSYDNLKQGLVFREKVMIDGLQVRLNDKPDADVYTIQREEDGTISAIHNILDESVKLTVVYCEDYGNLMKEVREIVKSDAILEEAGFESEGPFVPGISRIWMYGYLNGGKVYYDTTDENGKTIHSKPLSQGENKPNPCASIRAGWYVYGHCLGALPFRRLNRKSQEIVKLDGIGAFWDEVREDGKRKRSAKVAQRLVDAVARMNIRETLPKFAQNDNALTVPEEVPQFESSSEEESERSWTEESGKSSTEESEETETEESVGVHIEE